MLTQSASASGPDMRSSSNNDQDLTRNTILSRKEILQAIIVTFLILISVALLSIPIIMYYITSPEIREGDLQLPSHLVNLQTCKRAMDLVSN